MNHGENNRLHGWSFVICAIMIVLDNPFATRAGSNRALRCISDTADHG